MKKILNLFILLLFGCATYGQPTDNTTFRLVSDGFVSFSGSNPYTATITFFNDATGNGYIPTNIPEPSTLDTFRIITSAGLCYKLTDVDNATFNTIDVTVIPYGPNSGVLPTGTVLLYDPSGVETVPQVPTGSSGATDQLQAAIDTYNALILNGNSQNIEEVLIVGDNANGLDITNVGTFDADNIKVGNITGGAAFFNSSSAGQSVVEYSSATPLVPSQIFYKLDGTSNAITITPSAISGVQGRNYIFCADNVDNTITIDPNGSETIGGNATYVFTEVGECIGITATLDGWDITNRYLPSGIATNLPDTVHITQASPTFLAGDLVNFKTGTTTGSLQLADLDVDSLVCRGIVIAVDGTDYTVQTGGLVSYSGVSAGVEYFLSRTAGDLTSTVLDSFQYIGIGVRDDLLLFQPGLKVVNGGLGGASTASELTLSPSIAYNSGTAADAQTAFEYQKADVDAITGEAYRTNSISYTGQTTDIPSDVTTFWGEWGKYINAYDHLPDSLIIQSSNSGDVYIAYFRFDSNGTTATEIHRDTVTVASGYNNFLVDTTGMSLPTSRLYVCLAGAALGVFDYKSNSPTDSVGIRIVAGTIAKRNFSFSFHLTYKPTVSLQEQADKLRIWTSVGNDTMSWRDLYNALQDYDIINLPAQTIHIPFKINIPSNKKLFGVKGSTVLKLSGQNYATILECDNVENISIQGITFQGLQSSTYSISSTSVLADSAAIRARTNMGTGKGLVIKVSHNIYIADCEFKNFNGAGLDHQTGETSPIYVNNVQANGLWFYNCYIGMLIDEGEYSNYNTIAANNCLIGLFIEGANNTVTNTNLSNCRVGLVISNMAGGNSGHGAILGGAVNHNNLYGIYVVDIKRGYNISGVHAWTNGSVPYVKKSDGIKFINCHFNGPPKYEDGNANSIVGCGFHSNIKPTLFGTASYPTMTGNICYFGSGAGVAVLNTNVNNSPPVELEGSGSPVGSVTPNYPKQTYYDTSGGLFWKSFGILNTEWKQLN